MADTVIQSLLVRIEANTAQLRLEMDRAESRVSQASSAIDGSLKQVDDAFDRAGAHSTVLQKAVGAAFTGVGLAATKAVAGLVAITQSTLEYAQEVQNLSSLANTSVTDFQRLAAGARLVGVDQAKLADIYKNSTDRIGEFVSRGGGELQGFFNEIAPQVGVTAESFRNLSGPQALQLYYDSLEKAGASQQQITSYMEQMAGGATALVPLLRSSGEGFREAGDRAEEAGAVLSGLEIGRLLEVNQTVRDLQSAWDGATRQLVVGMLPAIETTTRNLQLMADNGGSQALGAAIGFLVDNFNILLGVMGTKVASSFLGYLANLASSLAATKQVADANFAQASAAVQVAIANQQAAQSAVIRAEKEAIAARGTAVQSQMSIQLAEARMVERAATDRLAVSQSALKGLSSGLMALLGGPVGLASLAVGAGIAFLTMGSNSKKAGDELEDLKRPVEELRKAFKDLDRDQRGATLVSAMRQQAQATANADQAYRDLRQTVKRGVGSTIFARISSEIDEARKAGNGLTDFLDVLSGRFRIDEESMGKMREAAGKYSARNQDARKATDIVALYQSENGANTVPSNAAGESDAKAESAGQTYLETLKTRLATLKEKTTAEEAERFITENKIKSESALASQIRERAKALDAQRAAESAAKDGTLANSNANGKLTRQLNEASAAYEQLRKTLDPVGVASDEFEKQVANLDLLLKKNEITQEQHSSGIALLADQFNAAVRASTGFSQAMKYQADLERQLANARQQGDDAAAAVGMGDKEAQRTQARLALEQDNKSKILALRDELENASTEKQRQALERQIVLQQQYGDKMLQAQREGFEKLDAAEDDWSNGARSAWQDYLASAADVAGQTHDVFGTMFSGAEDALYQFVKTGKLSFKGFADSVIEDLIRIQVRKAMVGFLDTAFDFLSGGKAALGKGIMTGSSEGSFVKNAKGGVYDSPSLSAFSSQVHDSPQTFALANGTGLFAEAGPEAIMPLARGPDGSLGVMAMSAAGNNGSAPFNFGGITQHFNFGAGAASLSREELRQAAYDGAKGGYEMVLRDFKTNGAGRQMLQRR